MQDTLLENPDLTLDQVMQAWPQTVRVFLNYRMLCVGCLINPFHTVTDACREYHLDETDFRRELADAVSPAARAG